MLYISNQVKIINNGKAMGKKLLTCLLGMLNVSNITRKQSHHNRLTVAAFKAPLTIGSLNISSSDVQCMSEQKNLCSTFIYWIIPHTVVQIIICMFLFES
jgi:hypothetical protein